MNYISIYLFLCVVGFQAHAQKYQTEKTKVVFFSEAMIENITAVNTKAVGIVDIERSQVAFSVPIIDFQFEKSLMQEHFNEKYMETEKYPKATFQGTIQNLDPKAKEVQKVIARGEMNIHGVEKEVEIPGELTLLKGGEMTIKAVFPVRLEDYNIEIPQLLWNNIAEEVEVTLEFQLKSMSK
ncbi:MAG: YceI family protein [Bacteroidota bacterium]